MLQHPFGSLRSGWVVERSWHHNQTLAAGGLGSQQTLQGWGSAPGKEGPAFLAPSHPPCEQQCKCWGLYFWDCQSFYPRYMGQQLLILQKIFLQNSTQHICNSSSILLLKAGSIRSQCLFATLQSVSLQQVMLFCSWITQNSPVLCFTENWISYSTAANFLLVLHKCAVMQLEILSQRWQN